MTQFNLPPDGMELPPTPEQQAACMASIDRALAAGALPDQECPKGGLQLVQEQWGSSHQGGMETGFAYEPDENDNPELHFWLHGERTTDRPLVYLELEQMKNRTGNSGLSQGVIRGTHPVTGVGLTIAVKRDSEVDLYGETPGSRYMAIATPDDPEAASTTLRLEEGHEMWLKTGESPPDLPFQFFVDTFAKAEQVSPNRPA